MDELFERLVYKLHETELVLGTDPGHPRDSSRYCPPCRERVEHLMPEIYDYLWNGALIDGY